MDNNQRKAKIQTYLLQLAEGNIQGNGVECLDFIHRNPGTNLREMSEQLFMPIQSSSSALSNLMDSGLVKEVGQIRLNDSFFSKLEIVLDGDEQDKLSEYRLKEKFKSWVKKGLADFDELISGNLREELNNQI